MNVREIPFSFSTDPNKRQAEMLQCVDDAYLRLISRYRSPKNNYHPQPGKIHVAPTKQLWEEVKEIYGESGVQEFRRIYPDLYAFTTREHIFIDTTQFRSPAEFTYAAGHEQLHAFTGLGSIPSVSQKREEFNPRRDLPSRLFLITDLWVALMSCKSQGLFRRPLTDFSGIAQGHIFWSMVLDELLGPVKRGDFALYEIYEGKASHKTLENQLNAAYQKSRSLVRHGVKNFYREVFLLFPIGAFILEGQPIGTGAVSPQEREELSDLLDLAVDARKDLGKVTYLSRSDVGIAIEKISQTNSLLKRL